MAWHSSVCPLLVISVLLALNPAPTRGQSPSQADFISIDCGASEPYTDTVRGLYWVTDTNYTSVGTNVNLPTGSNIFPLHPEYSNLRYFSKPRKKFCYSLPVNPNTTYILAATFWYGNYDGLNKPPKFMMAIDATENLEVDTTVTPTLPLRREIMGSTGLNQTTVAVCFYQDPAALQNPFVSSLEFRVLPFQAYETPWLNTGNFLFLFTRWNFGGTTTIRYPNDDFDRVWTPWSIPGTVAISAAAPVVDSVKELYIKPPPLVMQTAITPSDFGNLTLPYNYGSAESPIPGVYYSYFAEVNSNSTATSRVFTISFPGPFANAPSTLDIYVNASGPDLPIVNTVRNFSMTDTSAVVMNPVLGSTLPPLINGAELYIQFPALTVPTYTPDAVAIESIKVALQLTGWGGDPCLPIPIDWIGCSTASPPRVTSVNLGNYNLTGQIPPDFSELTALTTLDLHGNDLSGSIPASLATLPVLTQLILYNNNLTGTVPAGLNKTGLLLDIRGNPVCNCGTVVPPVPSPSKKSSSNVGIIAGLVGGVLVVVALVVIFCCICKRKPRNGDKLTELPSHCNQGSNGTNGSSVLAMEQSNQGAKLYSLAEITAVTQNYNKKIGEGGFGPVYYGKLPTGKEVAVKVSDANSRQGVNEFNNEVQLLSRVHHKNLVSLVGYCQEGNSQMLVYEFLHRGTVREHLYGSTLATEEPLDWKTRLDVALNSAQGLEYLHSGCIPCIIHRDVKSSNILLTEKYLAKVADFGLSKLGPEEGATTSHVSTNVKGTAGYLDPEYWSTNNLTERSDVYSFGVVMLELLCGRQPIDNTLENKSDRNIVEKVRTALQAGDIDSILDPAVKRSHSNIDSVWKMAEIAIQSVEPKGIHRPYMRDVVKELREAIQLELGHAAGYFDHPNASASHFPGSRHNDQSNRPDDSNAFMPFSESYKQPYTR